MSLIDHQEIQELLQNVKLSSMSDVIHFVLDSLVKLIDFQPIQDLAVRIGELQKPQGLDRIMIEEVKTLIQAIIEQKQDQIKKDVQKSLYRNVSLAMEQQNSRQQSLREIDMFQIFSKQNTRKNSLIVQPKSQPNIQIESIKKQLQDMKILLQRKPDKRQLSDFKMDIQKQLSNKITICETEKVIEKFQKQVFHKLNELGLTIQKMEYDLKKILINQASEIKKQFYESAKMLQLKQKMAKIEKKVKKVNLQTVQLVKQTKRDLNIAANQSKQSMQQMCNLIQNIQNKIKVTDAQVKTNTIQLKILQELVKEKQDRYWGASWSSEKTIPKNMSLCWDKELINENQNIFRFQQGKSQLIVTGTGFFQIQSLIAGTQKQPQMFLNSQISIRFTQSSKGQQFRLSEIVRLTEAVNRIWVKVDNQGCQVNAVLRIVKIG